MAVSLIDVPFTPGDLVLVSAGGKKAKNMLKRCFIAFWCGWGGTKKPGERSINDILRLITSFRDKRGREKKSNKAKKKQTNIRIQTSQTCANKAAVKQPSSGTQTIKRTQSFTGWVVVVGVGRVWGWGYCYISLDTFLLCGLFLLCASCASRNIRMHTSLLGLDVTLEKH